MTERRTRDQSQVADDPTAVLEFPIPFAVEADEPRNGDLLIQCIPGCKLRSAIDGNKSLYDAKRDEYMVPKDQAIALGSFPRTPGMQLYIDAESGTVEIADPLFENEKLLQKIQSWLSHNSPVRTTQKIGGVPPRKELLDKHRMKSLCREVYNLVKIGHMKVVRGTLPTIEEINEMPGRYLLNPGSRVENNMPVFEDEYEAYKERVRN